MMHLGDGARSEARIVPLLKKSLLDTPLEAAFKVLEDVTKSLFHGSGLGAALQELFAKQYGETLAQLTVLFLALMPLFAVRDIDEAMGGNALPELFFGKRAAKK